MYTIGIDVGGTNTDAVLLKGQQVVTLIKVPTEHLDLLSSTKEALVQILNNQALTEENKVRLQLSTTLSTNAIVEGKGQRVRVLTVPGPGVNLGSLNFPFPLEELNGYIDHRGREVSPLDQQEVAGLKGKHSCDEALAIVGKFSQRNPKHEQELGQAMSELYGDTISYGHRLSGRANFPRRIVTTYLNASVAQSHQGFIATWEKLLAEVGIALEDTVILKADGGTMSLPDSKQKPIETILSGPAASIMGVQALTKGEAERYIMVDIGGTTTDLAVVVDGQVLHERDGATISQYKTLVPAVLTRSLALGGDSTLNLNSTGEIIIGPLRAGRAFCLGGECVTPTDAAVALGLADLGSRKKAIEGLQDWAGKFKRNWRDLAQSVIETFASQLAAGIKELYKELDTMPLYTVSEVLNPPELDPLLIVGLGAPAPVFIPVLAEKLKLPHEILPFSAGANAIGAAAAQVTLGLTLHADTELGTLTIPELGLHATMPRPLFFDMAKAREFALAKTKELAQDHGYAKEATVHVVEEESFQMVRGFRTVGQVHRIKTQISPQVQKISGRMES